MKLLLCAFYLNTACINIGVCWPSRLAHPFRPEVRLTILPYRDLRVTQAFEESKICATFLMPLHCNTPAFSQHDTPGYLLASSGVFIASAIWRMQLQPRIQRCRGLRNHNPKPRLEPAQEEPMGPYARGARRRCRIVVPMTTIASRWPIFAITSTGICTSSTEAEGTETILAT